MSPSRLTHAVALILTSLSLSPEADARVTLPGGKTIPKPALTCRYNKTSGLAAVFACACTKPGICNIGKPCPGGSARCDPGTNGTCETTLWHKANDNPCLPTYRTGLDPVGDATVKPETFKPACGLTFSLLTRGNAIFQNGFGWYNVTPGKKPTSKDLHLLVGCRTRPGARTPFNLRADPRYRGGKIGFFLVTPESRSKRGTCARGDCCASVARAAKGEGYVYYSESRYNPDSAAPAPYIHLLTYRSRIDKHAFYFAWEDTYDGTSTDYSDFVTSVSGIQCAGAGVLCDTGKPGVCGPGVRRCGPDGTLTCASSLTPQPERCDGLDNDCDGAVDEQALCPVGKVCHRGSCVPRCARRLEFRCQPGYVCDAASGLCVDRRCAKVTCKKGEVCRAGRCANGCLGVVCPPEQVCRAGVCVAPCAGRVCKGGEICWRGVCLPRCDRCGGRVCTRPLACDKKSGRCLDLSCKAPCSPGSYCKGGRCVPLCSGVRCPGGVPCKDGRCPPPAAPGPGNQPPPRDAGPPARADDGGADGNDALDPELDAMGGCRCDAAATPRASTGALAALAMALLLALRRARPPAA